MSRLSTALSWVSQQRKAHIAETGTITRGLNTTSGVSMTVAKTMAEVHNGDGVMIRTNVADFLITAADYQINGVVVEPRRGDIITYGGKQYRALPVGQNEIWRYAENVNRTTIRVHTKEYEDA